MMMMTNENTFCFACDDHSVRVYCSECDERYDCIVCAETDGCEYCN